MSVGQNLLDKTPGKNPDKMPSIFGWTKLRRKPPGEISLITFNKSINPVHGIYLAYNYYFYYTVFFHQSSFPLHYDIFFNPTSTYTMIFSLIQLPPTL